MNSYVGIDVSKDELVVHVLPAQQDRVFPNTAQGLVELVGWLVELGGCRVAFEASGGYERDLLDALHQLRDGEELALPGPSFLRDRVLARLDRTEIGALLHDAGLLVEDYRVAPYCPRCGTAHSR